MGRWRAILEPIVFALAVTTTLDHRPTRIARVMVEPLVTKHYDEYGEQGDQ